MSRIIPLLAAFLLVFPVFSASALAHHPGDIELTEGTVDIKIPLKIEAVRGETTLGSATITNGLNSNLTSVRLEVVGDLPQEWITLFPESFDFIAERESKGVAIILDIPDDAEIYTYPLTFRLTAETRFGELPYSADFNVLLMEPLDELLVGKNSGFGTNVLEFFKFFVTTPILVGGFVALVLIATITWMFQPKEKSYAPRKFKRH